MKRLLVFGAGFSAKACALRAAPLFDRVTGTTRSAAKAADLSRDGIEPLVFDGMLTDDVALAIAAASHVLVSVAPDGDGDPVLNACRQTLAASPSLQWICYLSTVGVYGDHDGGWVSEESVCHPVSDRSVERVAAEKAWQELADSIGVPLAIFRLSGIYGPGRNAFVNIANGTSRRLVKPGQVFNRIHRDDIAKAFVLACEQKAAGIFNITDDEPAPPQDVVAFAHELAGNEPPPEIDFATAELSPMARSFYGENKRVSNAKSKAVLGMEYDYPNYSTSL
ncbi:MAG TPA: SDR family oxidoreductase [Rhizobiaceae bacterium]|nr:SDR family oxidoreductase [Rhizobiaceae bacterium]